MRIRRAWSIPVAAALLAVLAFTGLAAGLHRHDLAAPAGHPTLPSFATGHARPDRTLHVEVATRAEVEPCVACLLRAQPRHLTGHDRALGDIGPEGDGPSLAEQGVAFGPPTRLPATRAPPRA